MPDKPASIIPTAIAKALSDKLFDKQRSATRKVERLIRDALDDDDEQRIYEIIAELTTDFATSERETSRIGGIVALAGAAVALTPVNLPPFLPQIIPPMVSALSDGESKVRYFACESLYNVTKVSRGYILRWFNEIFDGLARVTADSVKSVKDGADYLDRMIKDIVAEQAATCLDWYEIGDSASLHGAGTGTPTTEAATYQGVDSTGLRISGIGGVTFDQGAVGESGTNTKAPGTKIAILKGPRLAFSLENFIPLLSERMHTYKPSTRLYLIEWIRVLDSVPGLDLITYLPEFLDGLIRFLSDPSDEVRNNTLSLLGELIYEIRECVEIQRLGNSADSDGNDSNSDTEANAVDDPDHESESESQNVAQASDRKGGDFVTLGRARSSTIQSDVQAEGRFALETPRAKENYRGFNASHSSPAHRISASRPPGFYSMSQSSDLSIFQARHGWTDDVSTSGRAPSTLQQKKQLHKLSEMSDGFRMAARKKKIRAERIDNAFIPGASVVIKFDECVSILIPHLESNDQEIQGIALCWIYEFTWLCPEVMIEHAPNITNAILPSVSHPVTSLRHTAEDANQRMYELVLDSLDPRRTPVQPNPKTIEKESLLVAEQDQKGDMKGTVTTPKVPTSPHKLTPVFVEHGLRPSRPLPPITSTTAAMSTAPRPQSPCFSTHSVGSTSGVPTRSRAESLLQASTISPVGSVVPSRVATPGPQSALKESKLPPVSPKVPPVLLHTKQIDVSSKVNITEPFNYDMAATAIMELFARNVHEPTKVAGMKWLLLLHRKAPWRILTPDDMSLPVLLKMLSDPSEQVVKLDLELLAQISLYSQNKDLAQSLRKGEGLRDLCKYTFEGPAFEVDTKQAQYLSKFMGSLLEMFAKDRALLEARGALMVRQLCVVLDPELVFCLFSKLLVMPGFGLVSIDSAVLHNTPAMAQRVSRQTNVKDQNPGSSSIIENEGVSAVVGSSKSDDEGDPGKSTKDGKLDSANNDSSDGVAAVATNDATGPDADTNDYESDEGDDGIESIQEYDADSGAAADSSSQTEEDAADLEFISVMVQHLSWILVTAPETERLRYLLRQYNARLPLQIPEFLATRLAIDQAATAAADASSSGLTHHASPELTDSLDQQQQQQHGHRSQSPQQTGGTTAGRGWVSSISGRRRGGSSGAATTQAGGQPVSGSQKQPQQTTAQEEASSPANIDQASAGAEQQIQGTKPVKLTRTSTGGASIAQKGREQSTKGMIRGAGTRRPTGGYGKGSAERKEGAMRMQQRRQHEIERLRQLVATATRRVDHDIKLNQRSHGLFATLFMTWSHNPVACLTLCLLSQHYEVGARLIAVFGQQTQDLTVSFLVQLDKLVQLIESPVFTYLRLQLLDPVHHPHLLRALYGLLMLLPQSSAFAILRNRLSTVAMIPFPGPFMASYFMQQESRSEHGGPSLGAGASRSGQVPDQHFHYHYHANGLGPGSTNGGIISGSMQPSAATLASTTATFTPSDGSTTAASNRKLAISGSDSVIAPHELNEVTRLLTASAEADMKSLVRGERAPGNNGVSSSSAILNQLSEVLQIEGADWAGDHGQMRSAAGWSQQQSPGVAPAIPFAQSGGAYGQMTALRGSGDQVGCLGESGIGQLLGTYERVRMRHSNAVVRQQYRR